MNRRAFLGTLSACAATAGCAGDWWRLGLGGGNRVTPETVAALDSPAISAKVGDARPLLLGLVTEQGPDLYWGGAEELRLMTRWGRVLQTSGLARNLHAAWFRQIDPLGLAPQKLEAPARYLRWIEIDAPGGPTSYRLDCVLEPVEERTITILETPRQTVMLLERNEVDGGDWSFENRFWVDARTGFAWQGEQFLTPDASPVLVQMLTPPSTLQDMAEAET